MKKSVSIALISYILLLLSVPTVQAQTATPIKDTRIECVTRGAQQICTTTTIERISSGSAQPTNTVSPSPNPTVTATPTITVTPKLTLTVTPTPLPGHTVVDTGLEENVMIGIMALFLFSSFAYLFTKAVK